MKRGEVYNAQLEPTIGSEQAGFRPVILVSRDVINNFSQVVLVVPCTTYRGQRIYPSQIVLRAPDGGLDVDSIAMAEQVRAVDKARFGNLRGTISETSLQRLGRALSIALDLPGQ